jgi:arabinofuranan 3-O-arabinosyltransferase
VALLAVANLPALWTGAFIDSALERDQDPPEAWVSAARDLDAAPSGFRVLQLPGAEFGAFRWGYTVDQPLPGLTERPLVTRDLLPLGSPAAMDLLYAFDDRIQMGVAEAGSLAPVARLLGVDTVWLTNDQAFDRFRTPRPDLVARAVTGAPDTGEVRSYGPTVVNVPDIAMIDEQAFVHGASAAPRPIVELVPIDAPVAIVRAKGDQVVLAGSGDGIVDAAATGLIDGAELIRYAAALSPEDLAAATRDAGLVIVTDSNRARARMWRGSQDVTGFTEDGGPDPQVLRPADGDTRLPVFERAGPRHQTTAIQVGPVRARASAYGEPFAYRPESRAAMAIDGELSTAWVVADRFGAEGEHLLLEADAPVSQLTLRQPDTPDGARRITEVAIRIDDAEPFLADLDQRSLTGSGQLIDIPPTDGPATFTITITATDADPASPRREQAVGFARVDLGLGPTLEVVKLPTDAVSATGPDTQLAYVFTRERVRPTDRWRADPEPALVRQFAVPQRREVEISVVARLDQRASDLVLADLLGTAAAEASNRLHGVARAMALNAADADRSTAWTSAFGAGRGSVLRYPVDAGVAIDRLTITQPVGDLYSTITEVRIVHGDNPPVTRAVPPPDGDGRSTLAFPGGLGDELTIEITGVDERTTIDRRYAEPVVLPVAISELDAPGLEPIARPGDLDTGCRDDLVTLDGTAIGLRIVAGVEQLLDGAAITAQRCGDDAPIELEPGARMLQTARGADTGIQIDQVVLRSVDATPTAEGEATPLSAEVRSSSRTSRSVDIGGCDQGCWLVLGEGFSDGWTASVAGVDLGRPEMVDGGFNGWRVPPLSATGRVEIRWTPQPILVGALVASALAMIICVALVVADRRRRPPLRVDSPSLAAGWRLHWARDTRRRAASVTIAWMLMAGLAVQPQWAVAAFVIGAIAIALGSVRVIGVAALAVGVWIGSALVYRVVTDRPFPNAGWVLSFTDLHRLGLFLVTALLASALVPDPPPQQSANSAHPSA